ncbi:N-acetylmuramoyl-L-alanine amidase [Jiella sonneratiae]|uniref:N-acetylmuramoyl-L-alanine amidase n=1 Tax=Jiella sonneratiae TaxID=2816856 RepID=A0ABS3IXC9_9HYPH|nr:N-acetylmuramoyl-L-alanine amidase [Jiella sonneratiae]MBO0902069.1 N-acetylmuramoyl-L-alanine amidase [Jiella sonneratiae]
MTIGRRLAAIAFHLCVGALLVAGCRPAQAGDERVITQIEPIAGKTGLVVRFILTGKTAVRSFALKNPDRIAVDFDDAVPAVPFDTLPDNPLVETVRHGMVTADRYRVIFKLKAPAVATIDRTAEDGKEVVEVDIAATGDAGRAAEPVPAGRVTAAKPSGDAPPTPGKGGGPRRLVIVIDPGHGGEDQGALSPSGTMEKTINLANAKMLRDILDTYPNVDAELTRNDDTFIPLDERAAIARKLGADLFLSIHADSIHYKSLRGATVYTLSEDASDELARQIAANENASDRFAPEGLTDKSPEVFDILLDLTRRETVSFSEHFAAALVADLSAHKVDLINRPKRSAGFRVLKSPDVPSVLVEMGFLSNTADEKLLKNEDWRRKITSAIAESIIRFFRGGKADALKAAQKND